MRYLSMVEIPQIYTYNNEKVKADGYPGGGRPNRNFIMVVREHREIHTRFGPLSRTTTKFHCLNRTKKVVPVGPVSISIFALCRAAML